jgi:hypothetical protein
MRRKYMLNLHAYPPNLSNSTCRIKGSHSHASDFLGTRHDGPHLLRAPIAQMNDSYSVRASSRVILVDTTGTGMPHAYGHAPKLWLSPVTRSAHYHAYTVAHVICSRRSLISMLVVAVPRVQVWQRAHACKRACHCAGRTRHGFHL